MVNTEATIVSQYTTVVGALDQMFQEMDLRSNGSLWRWKNSPFEGVGSCKYISKSPSESGLVGPARNTLIELRQQRVKDFPGSSSVSSCPYHRENHGCVLGNLKSPLCISHIDGYDPMAGYDELRDRFGIKSNHLTSDISWILRSILESNDPTQNSQFISEACNGISQMTQHIKRFPILHTDKPTQVAISKI